MRNLKIGKAAKGKPAPERRGRYPWATMEVGDTFFIPGYTTKKMRGLGGTISAYRKRHGMKKEFTCRKDVEDGVTGITVWRTK